MEVAIVFMFLFAIIFGIFYLFFSTRNKERLALIDKGVDATIFMKGQQNRKAAPFWKILILNLGLLAMGIGTGMFVGSILYKHLGFENEVAYIGSMFLCAGGALLIGFQQTKKLDKE
ncbi:hypothetical protein CW731_07150 [Polaribacter sp. ALD11]|uniref:DUF6249 domain-containing protein n=1 Tax=Polaribacter sp. ALD11 TaxID=2058137 RepID=UPI000C305591|nr:DUF6249 domain-containing protein [Polaribacter sp. ALD11]AUC85078.1 hypothetical protein CW731_07150 [Polaribacter sp. ALD11]